MAVKRAAEIADLPAEDQRDLVEHMAPDDIVTNHERIKKDRKRKATFERIQAEAQPTQEWPTGRYSVIYADPPTEDDYGHTKRDVEHHYPTMTWDEVKDLAVNDDHHRGCGALFVGDAAHDAQVARSDGGLGLRLSHPCGLGKERNRPGRMVSQSA